MRSTHRSLLLLALAAAPFPVLAQSAPAAAPTSVPVATQVPADAKLYFISPTNGQRISSPLVVRFGLQNMGVTHAGDNTAKTGHHHLLVDVNEKLDPKDPIPSDKTHLHFGGGQTETKIDLAPGKHKLQLVLGDGDHRPTLYSTPIEVTVGSPTPRRKRPRHRYYYR